MDKKRDRAIDRTGQTYGKLTVIKRLENHETPNGPVTRWLVRCECGTEKAVQGPSLAKTANGKQGTKSCGKCGPKEWSKTHGMAGARIYRLWNNMLQRCSNPKLDAYPYYGGRGIEVCERWKTFENFYEDMGDPPVSFTLDRTDNAKGYSKDNCRWVNRKTQGNNRRSNVILEHNGERRTIAEWGDLTGLGRHLISHRLRRGWTVGQALTTSRVPSSRPNPKTPFHGKS